MKLIVCHHCGQNATKTTGCYNESIKNGWNLFCSLKCRYSSKEKAKELVCAFCAKSIKKTPAQIRQTKLNVFCNKSCAASYNNQHKKFGTRRSKLEIFLEEQINLHFPTLQTLCNSNSKVGLELDFYFPELKLAIEFNGHLHYKPIYGINKLNRIKELDNEKILRCLQMGIELIIIDVSNEHHLTLKIKENHWKTIKELVISKMKCADYTNEQVSFL